MRSIKILYHKVQGEYYPEKELEEKLPSKNYFLKQTEKCSAMFIVRYKKTWQLLK